MSFNIHLKSKEPGKPVGKGVDVQWLEQEDTALVKVEEKLEVVNENDVLLDIRTRKQEERKGNE